MDEIILIEAVEKYLKGEMQPQERQYFEELRKNNFEVDQMVVEHSYFLSGLEKYNDTKAFKHTLIETEAKLLADGVLKEKEIKGTAKVIQLWKKYKRSIAVAASIAAFVSLLTAALNIAYNKKTKDTDIFNLKRDITADIKRELGKTVPASTVKSKQPVAETAKFGGTGFIIDGKGYIVTNAHVISGMKNIYVANSKGDAYAAVPVYIDKNADLAIIKIADSTYKPVTNLPYTIRKSSSDLGEQFFTLGFPRNEIVYGEGYVSAKSGSEGDSTAYQLSVSANPGNSGGPVVNRNGEIIGIITAKNSKADGVVYAAKSKNIFRILDELKKQDSTQNVKTPAGSALKGIERVQQVKKMENFVFMVVGN